MCMGVLSECMSAYHVLHPWPGGPGGQRRLSGTGVTDDRELPDGR